MSALSAARLLGVGSAWRISGLRSAGRALARAATRSDPDDRMLAGILLTRAGDRSVPVIVEALATDADPTALVDVLASIGTDAARAALLVATRSSRPDLADAAAHALRTLDQQHPGAD